MSSEAMVTPQGLVSLRQQALTSWQGLGLRERIAIGVGLGVLALLLVWWLAVQPALRTLREAPAKIDQLDRELQLTRAMSDEVKMLRSVAPVSAGQAGAALKSATDPLGDKARLALLGDRATLTLTGIEGEALRSWLSEARAAARARPVEASLSRGPQGYSGSLVVSLGAMP